jgi:two-component system, NarL family, response regulator DevR
LAVRVLIVDRSAHVRSRLGERFADEGFDVLHAPDAGAAVSLLRLGLDSVAAIVLDLHGGASTEPAIDGLVRLRFAATDAMIVVLTNEIDELVRTECIRRGADFFFDKSRDFERAVEAVIRFSSVTKRS